MNLINLLKIINIIDIKCRHKKLKKSFIFKNSGL